MPSLRWIHENLIPPYAEEESSDIDDSCSDDSCDSDIAIEEIENNHSKSVRENERNLKNRSESIVAVGCNGVGLIGEFTKESYRQSRELKLLCRTGFFIGSTSFSDRIKGFSIDTNENSVRFVTSSVTEETLRLQNIETGRYLAFNATGHLYGELSMGKDNTVWKICRIGDYYSFLSIKYRGWWIGIKKNGRHLQGPKTALGQKAIQFSLIYEN